MKRASSLTRVTATVLEVPLVDAGHISMTRSCPPEGCASLLADGAVNTKEIQQVHVALQAHHSSWASMLCC